ncbi:MAG: A/G-specific adenine glycosylase [Myxococcales bacterium]|nr:A/G-specific adenine glycosylase [Myxococcales bacterium]
MPDSSTARDIAKRVVRYYRRTRRDLPWRNNVHAYSVWISEIMLQQTRVAAVIPYYERWLRSFPTIEALAEAELDDVLAHWSGLGYYNRARNIHSCAKEVRTTYNGRLPSSAKELRALPGIGRYTAGAVSSIAYNQHEALVDGNVARVVSRVFAIEDELKSTAGIKEQWRICGALVPRSSPGDFNQGLMEIGALLCKPKNPECSVCPLMTHCRAYREERTNELPSVAKRKAAADKPLLALNAAYLERGGKLLLGHRKAEGLFGGLWELPTAPQREELSALTGLKLDFYGETASIEHAQVLSHRRLHIQVWPAQVSGRTHLRHGSPYQRLAWLTPSEVPSVGISTATKSILERTTEIRNER